MEKKKKRNEFQIMLQHRVFAFVKTILFDTLKTRWFDYWIVTLYIILY